MTLRVSFRVGSPELHAVSIGDRGWAMPGPRFV